jgi:hypothetical protein
MPCRASWTIVALAAAFGVAVASAQTTSIWVSRDDPAIQYSTRPTRDAVVKAERVLEKGKCHARVRFAAARLSRVRAESIRHHSGVSDARFSENSLQRDHISKQTPRAVYFNDSVAVGWAKGADTIEAAVLDATQGVQFYTIGR